MKTQELDWTSNPSFFLVHWKFNSEMWAGQLALSNPYSSQPAIAEPDLLEVIAAGVVGEVWCVEWEEEGRRNSQGASELETPITDAQFHGVTSSGLLGILAAVQAARSSFTPSSSSLSLRDAGQMGFIEPAGEIKKHSRKAVVFVRLRFSLLVCSSRVSLVVLGTKTTQEVFRTTNLIAQINAFVVWRWTVDRNEVFSHDNKRQSYVTNCKR